VRDPEALAQLRDWRCKQDQATIAQALYGNWRAEHLFALRQAVAAYRFCHHQIRECDVCIETQLKALPAAKPTVPLRPRVKTRRRNRNRPCLRLAAAVAPSHGR
jgi:hypothetical protein